MDEHLCYYHISYIDDIFITERYNHDTQMRIPRENPHILIYILAVLYFNLSIFKIPVLFRTHLYIVYQFPHVNLHELMMYDDYRQYLLIYPTYHLSTIYIVSCCNEISTSPKPVIDIIVRVVTRVTRISIVTCIPTSVVTMPTSVVTMPPVTTSPCHQLLRHQLTPRYYPISSSTCVCVSLEVLVFTLSVWVFAPCIIEACTTEVQIPELYIWLLLSC